MNLLDTNYFDFIILLDTNYINFIIELIREIKCLLK